MIQLTVKQECRPGELRYVSLVKSEDGQNIFDISAFGLGPPMPIEYEHQNRPFPRQVISKVGSGPQILWRVSN